MLSLCMLYTDSIGWILSLVRPYADSRGEVFSLSVYIYILTIVEVGYCLCEAIY